MSTLELELYSESEKREKRNRTVFEYGTALVIPSLALIASAAAVNSHPRITIALVVLACASFVAGLFPPVYASARHWRARRAAEAVAEMAFPEIKKFVRRFEDFVYQDFAKNLAESTLALGDLPRYLPLPQPV